MTTKTKHRRSRQTRDAALSAWQAAAPARAAAARDARRIDAREDDIEHGHRDPIVEIHLDAMQDRYERSLGWGVE